MPLLRMEAGTNLIGGQPFSLENLGEGAGCVPRVRPYAGTDVTALDNLYFIKEREESCKYLSVREITRRIANTCDIIYFSARKLGSARGSNGTLTRAPIRPDRRWLPFFEGSSPTVVCRCGRWSARRGSGRDHGRGDD